MLKKTLIAAGAAALLAAGIAGSTTPASAGGYYGSGHVGGNGWYFGWGYPKPWTWNKPHFYKPPVQKVCQPIYKKVRVFRPYYGWVWQTVYAGQTCSWQPLYRHW